MNAYMKYRCDYINKLKADGVTEGFVEKAK